MRYYFDVSDDGDETRDLEGVECADEAQMQRQAAKILTEIAHDNPSVTSRMRTRVRDAEGRPVYELLLHLEGRAL